MGFSSWSDFFHMGGYAFYVWASYGLTLAVLGGLLVAIARRHRQLQADLERRTRREQRSRDPS
ncbi:MAG: heme exporter protein CcmD [Gammaproteobacteria bacterium]|nr:heme exporter protein CcmD [Gammaproteobacteria bacterium]MCP5424823.1 heme exporter protein CcmD [Gammaproteobacteria bacterium]MCP5458200.1 heme exporter protein CcmD [Gammaproteobacteria bacterium]